MKWIQCYARFATTFPAITRDGRELVAVTLPRSGLVALTAEAEARLAVDRTWRAALSHGTYKLVDEARRSYLIKKKKSGTFKE